MLLAVSGSRVALGSPVRVSQGIKDSSATLKYYKRNITYLGLKKREKGRTESRKEGKRSRGSKQRTQEAEIIQRLGD